MNAVDLLWMAFDSNYKLGSVASKLLLVPKTSLCRYIMPLLLT